MADGRNESGAISNLEILLVAKGYYEIFPYSTVKYKWLIFAKHKYLC